MCLRSLRFVSYTNEKVPFILTPSWILRAGKTVPPTREYGLTEPEQCPGTTFKLACLVRMLCHMSHSVKTKSRPGVSAGQNLVIGSRRKSPMTKNCNIAKLPTKVVDSSQQSKFGTRSFQVRICHFVSHLKSEIVYFYHFHELSLVIYLVTFSRILSFDLGHHVVIFSQIMVYLSSSTVKPQSMQVVYAYV